MADLKVWHFDIAQGTDEWKALRLGKVTASRVSDIVTKTKTGWGASRANYMAELIAERLSGAAADRFTNAAMQHGTEQEPNARLAYQLLTGADVTQVAFIEHPAIPLCGASPDGLADKEGLVEIKCPNTATHIDTLLGGSVPSKYVAQMQWQMACSGRAWCHLVSYDPRLPVDMQLFVKRVGRDDKAIFDLETAVREFQSELEAKMAALVAACRSGG